MALKFWLGAQRSDKSTRLIEYILNEADLHPDRQFLFVVPEQFGLSTQQQLVLSSKNHGILNIDVLSFTRLAHRITDEVGSYAPDTVMLDEMGKSLLIGMLANSNKQNLKIFADSLDKLGCIDRIKSLISEFMQYGITVDKAYELAKAAEDGGRNLLAGKLYDVAFIYKEFKEYISNRYTTVEETLERLSDLVPYSETIKNSVIVFDGFTGFTPIQNKLLGVLMEYAIDIHVALILEDCIQENPNNTVIREHELFYLSKSTMNNLGRMADERHIVIADPYKDDKHAFSNACNLKGDIVYKNPQNNAELNNSPEQTDEIEKKVFAGSDPQEEIDMVFTRIKDLIRERGYHYKDIAILAGDLETYRHPVERCFAKHDIPYFIDRTQPVLLNPFVEYIRSFIDIISDNYSINAVFRFLKSHLSGFDDEEINLLENYCIAANIKGYKAWHERFDTKTDAAGADELLVLNGIRERFTAKCAVFTNTLSPGKTINSGSVFTVRQFCEALYTLADNDGIEDKLRAAANTFEEEGERTLAMQYGRIFVRIMNILEELCDLVPDEKTDIRGFGSLVDAGLDAIRIGAVPSGMDYIQVGDLTRSRLSDIKALFIVGANEGFIPNVSQSVGILNEGDRQYLSMADPDLVLAPTEREDVFTQQLYIYMAMNRPKECLFISYSRTSPSGKSLLPSYIVRGTVVEKKPEIADFYRDEAQAFDELCDLIYPAITSSLSKEKAVRIKELLTYFTSRDGYRDKLTRMVEKQILKSGTDDSDTIGSAIAHAMYGHRIVSSITRLEAYAKCAYRYFLQYGLNLKEREVFSFEAKDIGNIFHDSMKEYSQLVSDSGGDWTGMEEKQRHTLMDSAVDKVIERYRAEKLSSSARYAYMENRIRRIMRRSADVVSYQIKKGDFIPKYFEVDFDRLPGDGAIELKLSDEDVMRLRGRIDRVDTCEREDGIYLRIIDYKSSHHEMDLAAVYEGRQLQLLVYLNAATRMEAEDQKRTGNEREIIPAGVLYYHMDDPVIREKDAISSSDIERLISKKLTLSGLVNKDMTSIRLMDRDIEEDSTVLSVTTTTKGEVRSNKQAVSAEDLHTLSGYVTKKIEQMGCEILDGNVAIPVPDGKSRFTWPDCSFCPYDAICLPRAQHTSAPDSGDAKETDWLTLMRDYGKNKESTTGD